MDKTTTNMKMSDALEFITEFIKKQVKDDFRKGNGLQIVLDAYNRMRDDECAGTDYIFSINKTEDLTYLVQNGMMNAQTIAFVVNTPFRFPNGLFMFHGKANEGMLPVDNIGNFLLNSLDTLIPYVLLYVDRVKEYQEFYSRYFTDKVWQMDFFEN
jgi:hypothetical protein